MCEGTSWCRALSERASGIAIPATRSGAPRRRLGNAPPHSGTPQEVKIHEADFPEETEWTPNWSSWASVEPNVPNDYNLAKSPNPVGSIVNIHELARTMKPDSPGETFNLKIAREGKDKAGNRLSQHGTMVVSTMATLRRSRSKFKCKVWSRPPVFSSLPM